MFEFYPDAKERDTILTAMQKTGSVTDLEVQLKNRDGSFIPCSVSAKMSFNAEGQPEKIIGSVLIHLEQFGASGYELSGVGHAYHYGGADDAPGGHPQEDRRWPREPGGFGVYQVREFVLFVTFQYYEFPRLLIVCRGSLIGRAQYDAQVAIIDRSIGEEPDASPLFYG